MCWYSLVIATYEQQKHLATSLYKKDNTHPHAHQGLSIRLVPSVAIKKLSWHIVMIFFGSVNPFPLNRTPVWYPQGTTKSGRLRGWFLAMKKCSEAGAAGVLLVNSKQQPSRISCFTSPERQSTYLGHSLSCSMYAVYMMLCDLLLHDLGVLQKLLMTDLC